MAHSEKMTQTQSLFKGRIIEVKKDKVLLENGKETTREVVVHHGGVCIAAIDEKDNILLVKQFPGGFDALGGGQAAANHFLQGPLHTGIAVVAQLRSKAYNRGFTDPNQLAQLAGSHESRLVVMLQNIRRDPLLPLGKVAHTALNTM